MNNLTGYRLDETLYQGTRTEVYRGMRTSDDQPVIIKVQRNPCPTFNELVQFRNQYVITRHLEHPSIVQPIALERYGNGYVLIMPDEGAIALLEYQKKAAPTLNTFFEIAIQLADALHYLGQQRIIHKDIKPANIVICPQTRKVKLIDFSISTLLPKEKQQLINPNILEGTLTYISPEQTGRMNRGIDYRTDFYSLGITFFEMLTGQLPFTNDDPMELIHCHIAKMPPPLHALQNPTSNPLEIPPVISDIVMKLMAKNAEDRYQSAWGLKHDLEQCLHQYETTGHIASFTLGEQDRCDRFSIPEKLYGREKEVQTLLNAFERVANPNPREITNQPELGGIEMMLVAGFSGIGKTAVINEVHKPIVKQKGYFIKGKFDQFNRNIPFSAFVQAFQDLIGQLLGESDTALANWKKTILNTLGENGQVIVDVIPELEQIIGPQTPAAELSGNAAQNRFNLLFGKFVGIFSTKEHPLVIFLDDLQWADAASLKLLKLLMADPESRYLLILGAYRNNEVFPAHPLMLTLGEIEKNQGIISTLTLSPLAWDHINQLVAETLICLPQVAKPLTDLLAQKTQGNPFFTTQFLQGLYQENLIKFNYNLNYWEGDLAQIRDAALTDDVVEFMAGRLQKLPPETQKVLQMAACIGNQFNLDSLAIVCEQSLEEVATSLWLALQEELIRPLNEAYKFFQDRELDEQPPDLGTVGYRFLHDRVQQAAYSLIPDDQKQQVHLKIGRLLLKNSQGIEQPDHLFDIVNQLNIGRELIPEQAERNHLAKLNLQAGRKAKTATAYRSSLDYLNIGIELLPSESWQTDYTLTLALYTEAIASSYLNANFEQAEAYSDWVLERVDNILDAVNIYELKINQKIADHKADEALEIGQKILNKLGISPEDILNYAQGEINLPNVEDLAQAPEMTDPYRLAAMRLLMSLTSAATIAKPDLLLPLILTQVHLSLEGGYSNLAAFSYAWYGSLLCGSLGEIEKGYQSGQIALALLERFDCTSLKCQVMTMVYLFVYPWKNPIHQVLNPALESFKLGLETGDILYGSYSIFNYCVYLLLSGHNLDDVVVQQTFYIEALQKQRLEYSISLIKFWKYLALKLKGEPADELYQSLKNALQEIGSWGFCAFHLVEGILLYLDSEYEDCAAQLQLAKTHASAVGGWPPIGLLNFYDSLCLLALCKQGDGPLQQQYLEQVTANQKQLKKWADNAPMNYQHKYQLVEAERYSVLGHKTEAIELYDQAIAGAKDNHYLQEEALANEQAMQFYLEWGKEKVAASYLTDAYYNYARWGSLTKTRQLENKYPQLIAPILQSSIDPKNTTHQHTSSQNLGTVTTVTSFLDITSFMKASRAISQEINLDTLLSKLMKIVLENAGADKGALILNNSGNWEVVTSCINSTCELVNIPLNEASTLPTSLINTVKHTRKTLLVNNVEKETLLAGDSYFIQQKPKSLCCSAIVNQGQLIGILYLENQISTDAFTQDRIELLKLLSAQAAISIENARLYRYLEEYSHNLEIQVAQRTEALRENNQHLQQTLQQLQRTQTQLIQTEKMSSLGQMVAGVAHEINNPINFIAGNITHTRQYFQDLLELINLYEQSLPTPTVTIQNKLEDMDWEFLSSDLENMLHSMENGSNRIRQIVRGLQNFSRLNESDKKPVDIHEGLDNTLMIVHHRLNVYHDFSSEFTGERGKINIIKKYGDLPKVDCYASQLNQVFFNIITNAIDILTTAHLEEQPEIIITTRMSNPQTVLISIADNGPGMSEVVCQKVFDPFFTTKPIGQGTGLGLSTSYQIVTDQHGGLLRCVSHPGEGAEFIIEIPVAGV